MQKTFQFWPLMRAAGASLLLSIAAAAQSPPPPPDFYVTSISTGLRPQGIDTLGSSGIDGGNSAIVAVANSGEDSVSILFVGPGTVTFGNKFTGIPSPYGIAGCAQYDRLGQTSLGPTAFLVTSPSDNSVRYITTGTGLFQAPLQVGPQPHSIECFVDVTTIKRVGVVSNLGDNSLTVFDVATMTVTATIPNVPASRGFHGLAVLSDIASQRQYALVAGTDANVVTVVDLSGFRVLAQIAVARPTAITSLGNAFAVASAASNEVIEYDFPSFQVPLRQRNIPNPQDFVYSRMGRFATNSAQDFVTYWSGDPAATPVAVPGIPGAAALAAPIFSYQPPCARIVCATAEAQAVLVTSPNSNRVFIIHSAQFRPPPPAIPTDLIANAASFQRGRVAPGSLASAVAATGVGQAVNASSFGNPLPKTLAGVTLTIGGSLNLDPRTNTWMYSPVGSVEAPLAFVGPNQVNFQVPTGIALGTNVTAQLTKPDGSTLLTTFNILATAPGIFSLLQNGAGQGAVLNGDYSQNGNPQSILGAKAAAPGSLIFIFATGGGETDPPLLPGEAAPVSGNPLFLTRVEPTVTIGGIQANVQFSGMAPGWVGLWQINAQVPASVTPGPAVPLVVTAGGVSSNTVTIAVE